MHIHIYVCTNDDDESCYLQCNNKITSKCSVGRTGRMNKEGSGLLICTPFEKPVIDSNLRSVPIAFTTGKSVTL